MQRGPEGRILLSQEMHDQRVNAVFHRPHAVCPSLLTGCQSRRKVMKTGANSGGLKYRSTQFLLGRNAINKGAKSTCFQEPVQSLSARSKRTDRAGLQGGRPHAGRRGGPAWRLQGPGAPQFTFFAPTNRLRAGSDAFTRHSLLPQRLAHGADLAAGNGQKLIHAS